MHRISPATGPEFSEPSLGDRSEKGKVLRSCSLRSRSGLPYSDDAMIPVLRRPPFWSVAPEIPVRTGAIAVTPTRSTDGLMPSIILPNASSNTVPSGTPSRTPLSTTWPERTERRRVSVEARRFRTRTSASHAHHRATRESATRARTPQPPTQLRLTARPRQLSPPGSLFTTRPR